MKLLLEIILLLLIFFAIQNTTAETNAKINLNLQHVQLQEAIYSLAKLIHMNVILSPDVSGTVTACFQDISPENALDTLLASHDIVRRRVGKTWYLSPRNELIKHQQDQLKSQQLQDETSPLATAIMQLRYAKIDDITHLIQAKNDTLLSKRGELRGDPRTNTLYVQDTPDHLQQIKKLIHHLDIPVAQILIEARLASVDHDFEREMGISFGVQDMTQTVKGESLAPVVANAFSLAVAKLADGSVLDVKLAAMEQEGHGELISSPSLFTSNQQIASIESGEEIPYQEVSRSGATNVAFKKAVLSLKVIPQILPNDYVLLRLQVNQDKPNNRLVLGVPTISTRQITTQVLVKNGQTVVLGGIYESNHEQGQDRIPFLGKIPLVGLLFQQQNITCSKRELLIFVTPRIIS